MLYPLKFTPLFQYRIWGGGKLKTVLNKNYEGTQIGESWEISDVAGFETLVSDGSLKGFSLRDLIEKYKADFLGTENYMNFGVQFPLLIKYIDALTPLSIQVHPHDEIAKKKHNSFGKNEMWFVMESDEDSEILVGFDADLDRESFKEHIQKNTVLDVLNHEKVQFGDAFYIPTGRTHAIGAGVLLAEIQQTSDVTYRIFDYNRVDASTGNKRDLHLDLALDVIDFQNFETYNTEYKKEINQSNILIHTPYFKTNFLPIQGVLEKSYTSLDSFVILMCVKGNVSLRYQNENYSLLYGETILLPASISNIIFTASNEAQLLEIYL